MPTHFAEIRAGKLGVRIAATPDEIDAAQALRYRVFFEEMGAQPGRRRISHPPRRRRLRHRRRPPPGPRPRPSGEGAASVVGTYRLIQKEGAARVGRFYSAAEYDLTPIIAFPGRVLELGRSCVDAAYRGRAVMQLLWRGIAAYVAEQEIDLMFGCASLPGTDPEAMAQELTYLYGHHLAPPSPAHARRPLTLHRHAPPRPHDRRLPQGQPAPAARSSRATSASAASSATAPSSTPSSTRPTSPSS